MQSTNKKPEIGQQPSPGPGMTTLAKGVLALASRFLPKRIALEEVQDARDKLQENTRQGKQARAIYLDLLKDLASACGNAMRIVFAETFKEALKDLFRQLAS